MPGEPIKPNRLRFEHLVADPRLMTLLTLEDMLGIAAEIYITETIAEDPDAQVPDFARFASDPRRLTTVDPMHKVHLALQTYINKRVQAAIEPPPPPPPPDGDPPNPPMIVSPGNGDINQEKDGVTLAWTSGILGPMAGEITYDVCFGTSGEPPLVSADQAAQTYDTGPLAYDTVYYWKVTAKNEHGSTSGPLWSFRTEIEVVAPPPSGQEIIVLGGAGAATRLQNALDTAQPGDTIKLEAGALFTGNFVLPNKATTSTAFITITSTNPPTGPYTNVRMNPTTAALFNLPKLQSNVPTAALRTDLGAHHWRIKHLEILHNLGSLPGNGTGLALGDASSAQNTLASVAHNIEVLECYIHGTDAQGLKRGIALNSKDTTIARCHISNCWYQGFDSQAIAGWNGPGGYLIEDNFLEAGSENIMFGGSDPAIAQLVPKDITIIRNHFYKPLSWIGDGTKVVKNLFELKAGEDVLVEQNMFENNWAAAQAGSALLFKSVNQDGAHTDCIVQNVIFQHNVVRNVSQAFNWLATQVGASGMVHPRRARGFDIINNLFYNVDTLGGKAGAGRFLHTVGIDDVNLIHNTVFHTADAMVTVEDYAQDALQKNSNWFVSNNNFHDKPVSGLGWKGPGKTQGGGNGTDGTFQTWWPNLVFSDNLLADFSTTATHYPGNTIPANLAAVQYVNAADPGGNLGTNATIQAGSPYKGLATDNPGEDTGVDVSLLIPAFNAVKPW
jgi:hypothetical protein